MAQARRYPAWTKAVLTALVAAALLLAGVIWAMTGPLGRTALLSAVDGQEVAGYGVIELDGIEGNVLSRFEVARLRIRDSQGDWFIAEDAELTWRFQSLLSGAIRIEALTVANIEMLRRPIRAQAARESESGGLAVTLSQLSLPDIHLADGIVGPAAHYSVHGRIVRSSDGAVSASGRAARLDALGDQALFELTQSPDGVLAGDIAISAPPGGALAELLGLAISGWSLDGALNGALDRGEGQFTFQIGDAVAAEGALHLAARGWTLNASFNPLLWPALPDQVRALSSDFTLSAQGRSAPLAMDRLSVRSSDIELEAFDLLTDGWRADIALTTRGASRTVPFGLSLVGASARVQGMGEAAFTAQLDLAGLATAHGQTEAVSTRIEVERKADGYQIQTEGAATGLAMSSPLLGGLLGDQARFSADFIITRAFDRVQLQTAVLNGAGWSVDAAGSWSPDTLSPVGAAQLTLADLGPAGLDVSGPLAISAQATAPGQLALALRSESLVGSNALAPWLGRLEASAQLEILPASLDVGAIFVRTDAFALEAQASHSFDAGRWTASGDGLIELGALQGSGLGGQASTAFSLTAAPGGLEFRTQLETGEISVGDMRVTQPVVRLEAGIVDGEVSAEWRMDAHARNKAVNAAGAVSQTGDDIEFSVQSLSWGAVSARGEARLSGPQIRGALLVADSSADRRWRADLEYQGLRDAPFEGRLVGGLDAENWTIAQGVMSQAQIRLDGPLSALPFNAALSGALTGPLSVESEGVASISPTGFRLQAGLEGVWRDHRITAQSPLTLRADSQGQAAFWDVRMGDARLVLQAERRSELAAIISISNAPAEWLSEAAGLPPALGEWSLDAQLAQESGQWRGDVTARLSGVRPRDSAIQEALTADAQLRLDERAGFTLTARAGELEAMADLTRPGPIAELETLIDPGWRGQVDLEGPLDTLARLYLPPQEALTGHIDGAAQFEAGQVSGRVRLSDAAYRSHAAGLSFTPITIEAAFHNDQLQLHDARIGDSAGGIATGRGAIGWTQAGLTGSGEVQFERFKAVSRPSLSVEATGEVRFALDGQRLLVSGQSDLDQLSLTPVSAGGPTITQIDVVELNRPDQLDPPYRRPILIELDYHLRADDSLFVSSRAFTSEWSADVHVTGPVNRLNLNGAAQLERGQASLLTRVFTLQSGEISFEGPISDTRIALQASHQRAGFAVTARAEGSVLDPSLSFTSTPSLPEDEVLARLLFDQNSAALSPLQTAQLAAQLSGRNWLGGLGEAGRRIGVDRLDLREDDNGALALRGGRRLGEDVYLELETSRASALGTARIEWSITPDIVVLSRLTGDTDAELAVRWRREFD